MKNKMMKLFANELVKQLQRKLEVGYTVQATDNTITIIKNGMACMSLTDLEDYFNDAIENNISIDYIVDTILIKLQLNMSHEEDATYNFFFQSHYTKALIFPFFVNRNNQAWLNQYIHIPFLNLEICFELRYETEEEVIISTIDEETRKRLGVSTSELFQLAVNNIKKDGINLTLVSDSIDLSNQGALYFNEIMDLNKAYILSNRSTVHGAAAILSADIVKKLFKIFNEDLFIVISGTDDLIVAPKSSVNIARIPMLRKLLCNVNDDALSDQIYYLDQRSWKLKIYPS